MAPPSPSDRSAREDQKVPSPTSASSSHHPLPPINHPHFPRSRPHFTPHEPISTSSSSSTFINPVPDVSMAATSTLPPIDICAPRLLSLHMTMPERYDQASASASASASRPSDIRPRAMEYERRYDHHREPVKREDSRYEPYPRRGSEDKIVLPPPSVLRLPHDPYAPRHVLPSIQSYSPSWWDERPESRQPCRGGVQLPSLRSISGGNSPITATARPMSAIHQDRPGIPRDPYHALERPSSYPQPQPTPLPPYEAHQYRPAYHQPYSAPSRKTHPPPHDIRPASPLRVKHEPNASPPSRANVKVEDPRDYPMPTPPRYSPNAGRMEYEARRGSASSIVAREREGKEQVVGQTRRLAHLMSEQKRRESINSGFTELRSVLPTALPGDSKAIILRKALGRIIQLEKAEAIASGQSTGHGHEANEMMPTPSSSRPDWRARPLRPEERVPSGNGMGTARSSSTSHQVQGHWDRDGEMGRYDGEWPPPGEGRREQDHGQRGYDESPGSGDGPDGYMDHEGGRKMNGGGAERGVKRHWEDEEDRESVYSQERGSSGGSR